MKRKILPALVLGLVLFNSAPAAAGNIYIGGPWGTCITSLPYTITAPGAYYLSRNLTSSGTGNGITIAQGVKHVTLDLMGFTLNGSGNGRHGIYLNGSKNVEIRNGTVTGWDTGIREDSYSGKFHRIINVRAVGNNYGIDFSGSGHLIQGCEVTAASIAIYIASGTVSGCTVKFVDVYGIEIMAGIISDNVVVGTGAGTPRYGIDAEGTGTIIRDNKVSGCAYGIRGASGLNVIGNTVNAASGTTGIYMSDDGTNLLDLNTVTGDGTHYNAAYTFVHKRSNY